MQNLIGKWRVWKIQLQDGEHVQAQQMITWVFQLELYTFINTLVILPKKRLYLIYWAIFISIYLEIDFQALYNK